MVFFNQKNIFLIFENYFDRAHDLNLIEIVKMYYILYILHFKMLTIIKFYNLFFHFEKKGFFKKF
jgi:hypothetical protein